MNLIALYAPVVVEEDCGAWELSVNGGANYQNVSVDAGTYPTFADLLATMQTQSETVHTAFRWSIVRSSNGEEVRTKLGFQSEVAADCRLRFPDSSHIGMLCGFSKTASDTPDSYAFTNVDALNSENSPQNVLISEGVSFHDYGKIHPNVSHGTSISGNVEATLNGMSQTRRLTLEALSDTQWNRLVSMVSSMIANTNVEVPGIPALLLDLCWQSDADVVAGSSNGWIRLLPETFDLKHSATWAAPQPRYGTVALSFTEVD